MELPVTTRTAAPAAASLTLVPTPLGNMEDISLRALRTLASVDFILAEDTRSSSVLLKHHGIHTALFAYHRYNEQGKLQLIAERLEGGQHAALISDAGTPCISDPGHLLVQECIRRNLRVECLPGPTAFVPALVISGLPTEAFVFEGFLPHKKGRQTRIGILSQERRTVILYESPHRLVKTLEQLCLACGEERAAAAVRELSKWHEEAIRGTLGELLAHFRGTAPRGEFVLVLGGCIPKECKREGGGEISTERCIPKGMQERKGKGF
jgi:16S rRNA (cytidine1402-2'-O)-methyltransferase